MADPDFRPGRRQGLIEGVRQRMLAHLFLEAKAKGESALRHFFSCFDEYAGLLMWKVNPRKICTLSETW